MHTTPTFRLLRLTFAFAGPQPLMEHLTGLFAGHETAAPAAVVYETRSSPDGTCEVWAGDELLAARPTTAGVGDVLLWAVNRDVVAAAPSNLLLHAAAVERDGAALLLVGPPGSGKSTLAARLLPSGWRYLTDEAVRVDPSSDCVEPYPKPITLKAGSWPLLPALQPRLDERVAPYFSGAWFVRPAEGLVATTTIPVRAVVVLSALREEAPGIKPLPAGAALLALADQCFRFSDGPLDQIATMDRLVRSASCWTLYHGSLAADVAALSDSWTHEATPGLETNPLHVPVGAPASDERIHLGSGVQHLVYAEDSVLCSADGRTLHGLDARATAIVTAVLAGASSEQVSAHLAAVAGAPRVQVEADVANLLDTLRAEQLLGSSATRPGAG